MWRTPSSSTTMNNKTLSRAVASILEREYPTLPQLLNYKTDFELLVGVILSASTTDRQVNRATPALFDRFPTPHALASCADTRIIERYIHSVGLAKQKSRYIHACARQLVAEHNGKVPHSRERLLTLPGVGRKSAAVVLCALTDTGAIAVDTHFGRVVNRLGITTERNPQKIELDIMRLLPEKKLCSFSQRINWHGRVCCMSRHPACDQCCLRAHCDYFHKLKTV